MKKIFLFVCIVSLFFSDKLYSFEKISPEKLKSVIGQKGFNDGGKSILTSDTSIYDEEKQKEDQASNTYELMSSSSNSPGNFTIKRGVGVSIFVDDVVLLFRSVPDTTYWDTDGVR
jgi:hypothetical protein